MFGVITLQLCLKQHTSCLYLLHIAHSRGQSTLIPVVLLQIKTLAVSIGPVLAKDLAQTHAKQKQI